MTQNAYADLHLHTSYSDGTKTPSQLVEYAKNLGFKAIAVTDHDTVEGINESMAKGEEIELEVIPGVELSVQEGQNELHLLGYFIDWRHKSLLVKMEEIKKFRFVRLENMLRRLEGLGYKIDLEEVLDSSRDGTIGRLHVANFLIKKGFVKSVHEAFDRFLGKGKPVYEEMNILSAKEAINLIKECGGIPVLAHPALNNAQSTIEQLIEYGLMGIEVYHTSYASREMCDEYLKLAQDKGLLVTGGSDCHGKGKQGNLMGQVKLPYYYVEKLKKVFHNEDD